MAGPRELSAKDLEVLTHYAGVGNRELYWNYLAALPGNDGYGRLALGVVRNDNMPGATANAYAQRYALKHSERVLTEREWDQFGVNLIQQDLARRREQMHENHRPDLALNLPAKDVQKAHDKSFEDIRVDPNAWTPRKLLEATRQHDSEAEVEKLWTTMLNNDYLGASRGTQTLGNLVHGHGLSLREQAEYAADMGLAYKSAIEERSHVPANIIGREDDFYMRDLHGSWSEVHQRTGAMGMRADQMRDVTDADRLRELEDTYRLRQEREAARRAFHPDDPGNLISSPHPLARHTPRTSMPRPGDDPLYADLRLRLPLDVSDDKVAQVALRARHENIRTPDDLMRVELRDNAIVFSSPRPGHSASVEMISPAPPKEQSLAQAARLDEQAMQAQFEAQQQSQQMAMQRSGPVMRM